MKNISTDEWITTAMYDDSTVAELLLRLKKPSTKVNLPTFRWGLRQQRSQSIVKCDVDFATKDGEKTRFSPTTPLSWSGGGAASPSNTDVFGFETSSRLMNNCSSSTRSKGIVVTNEPASSISRKLKKRKTFSELKEEDDILMKERFYLNKEFATLHATFKEQTARNECLKRLKVEYNLHYPRKTMEVSVEPKYAAFNYAQQMQVSSYNQVPKLQINETSPKTYCMLPDLNTTPSENDLLDL